MAVPGNKSMAVEPIVLLALCAGLAASVFLTIRAGSGKTGPHRADDETPVSPLNFARLEQALRPAGPSARPDQSADNLLVSELRVVAIGSAYPIPYEAERCPFSQTLQPSMNQLDRDGDGITDDWELRYGLDRYNAADALEDSDGDGFSNLEEFQAATGPSDPEDHPAYAEKLRFIRRKDLPFPLVFQGFTQLADGSTVFQLNNPATGKSHFISEGESAEDIEIKRFVADEDGRVHRLLVARGGFEIELIRGETALDPESEAELINILDRSPVMVTMGALLSLHNDEYTVLGVYPDRVVLEDTATGKVYDIVGLAEGELSGFPEDRL